MSESLEVRIQSLRSKILQLLEKQSLLQEELRISQLENAELERIIQQQNEDLKSFQNREKIGKIVTNVAVEKPLNEERTTELKLKINEYIKEIDRCIAHLSKA